MYTRRLHSGTVCTGISPHFSLFRFIRKLHSRAACRYNYILRKSARSAPLHSSNQNYIRLPRVYLTLNRTVVVPLLEFPADPPQYDALYSNTRLLIPQFPANCRFSFRFCNYISFLLCSRCRCLFYILDICTEPLVP